MIDRLERALALVREAFEDARTGSVNVDGLDLAAEVELAQQVVNAATAVQAVRIAQFAAREEVQTAGGEWVVEDRGIGHVSEFAGDCFGPALQLTPDAADKRCHVAAAWASRLPVTLRAMADGSLDAWRATVIADELRDASPATCAQVEAIIFPAVLGETAGRVRARVRRTLNRVDADAMRERAARARADRFVLVRPGEVPGMSEWLAALPSAESAQCKAAIDELAHRLHREQPDLSLAQCRADAFVAIVLGNATVQTTVVFTIPVETATVDAPSDLPELDDDGEVVTPSWKQICAMGYEVPGVGVIPGDAVAAICSRFDTRIRRVLLDTGTGVVRETGSTAYRPPTRLATFVRLRDGCCRFPGCNRTARRCELDHVIPWPLGETQPDNLVSLCKHHHRVKHETSWRLTMTTDGVCTWTDPFGSRFVTRPVDHRDALAA